MAQRSALVVGGGLAGISAALQLSALGDAVTLVERSRVLGGLCRSVPDPVAGRVDTGQHVYLGCCSHLERFLERMEIRPGLRQGRLRIEVAGPSAGRSRSLMAAPLPPPAHLLPVLWGWPGLPTRQLLGAREVALSLRSLDPEAESALDLVPARSWLQSLGQDDLAIRRLWEPFLVAACNVRLERCSAALAAYVIREGLLASPRAGALRVPAADLTAWLDPSCRRGLLRAGVELRLGWRAASLAEGRQRAHRLESADGQGLEADLVVMATPAQAARRLLLARGLRQPTLEAAAALPQSPIVNLHLFTDRPFLSGPVVTAPGSDLQWLFDRSQLGEPVLEMGGAPVFHTAISLSAADDTIGEPEMALTERLWRLCQELFPAARRARLQHHRVTREASATFAALPGSRSARPRARTALEGVLLAGSWTDTGWPATMEGAVRSGEAAALATKA